MPETILPLFSPPVVCVAITVFVLQGTVMAVDEFRFHRRRTVPRWERVGHPLDTLTVLLPLAGAILLPPVAPWTAAFLVLAVFSCLFITKDEWVHARHCEPAEQWLHAVLFLLHPMLFLMIFLLWRAGETGWLLTQTALVAAFCTWQSLYWNGPWAPKAPEGPQHGTPVNNAFYDDLGARWLHAQDDPVALLRAEGVAKQAWVREQLEKLTGVSPVESSLEGRSQGTFSLKIPLKILDVGCGAGFLARALRAAGHEVHALDWSLPSLHVSRGVDASLGYVRGDALKLPYRDEAFDVITSMDFLEHVEDPAACIREAARVLRPGGLFFFHTFNRNPLSWLVIIKGVEWCVRNTPKHMHVLRLFITPRELAGYCRVAGMEPVAWTGMRPDFLRRAFWRMLATRVVPGDFRFVTTRSLLLSYLGVARKRE